MKHDVQMSIQWHITDFCPNHCKHCYMDSKQLHHINLMQYDMVMNKLDGFEEKYHVNIPSYCITGGDPMSNPWYKEMLVDLAARGKHIVLMGIPEQISTDTLEFFKQIGLRLFQVSLDGMEYRHDDIRGLGSFSTTINAIKMLNEYKIPCCIMYTVSRQNYQDMFDLINYLHSIDIEAIFSFDYLVAEGAAQNNMMEMVDKDIATQLTVQYYDKAVWLKTQKSKIKLSMKSVLLKTYAHVMQEHDIESTGICNGCYNGLTSICILPNGDVYPCRRLPIKIGNIYTDSFDNIFLENDLMKKFRRSEAYKLCNGCKHFRRCRGCPAVTYSLTGDPFEHYPYCFLREVGEKQDNDGSFPNYTNKEEEFKKIMNIEQNTVLKMKQVLDMYLNAKCNVGNNLDDGSGV